jgi:hypothetical protein
VVGKPRPSAGQYSHDILIKPHVILYFLLDQAQEKALWPEHFPGSGGFLVSDHPRIEMSSSRHGQSGEALDLDRNTFKVRQVWPYPLFFPRKFGPSSILAKLASRFPHNPSFCRPASSGVPATFHRVMKHCLSWVPLHSFSRLGP